MKLGMKRGVVRMRSQMMIVVYFVGSAGLLALRRSGKDEKCGIIRKTLLQAGS